MLFTTSWDDGYALDLRIASLLEHYGLTGTFYVCPKEQHGRTMLTEREIRELAQRHEIGAHTLTHPKLTQISTAQAEEEIRGSKAWVERVTGKPCRMFCYPKGDESDVLEQLVRDTGFTGARTTQQWRFTVENPLAMPVSLQIVPFPFRRTFHPAWKLLDPLGPLRTNWQKIRDHHVPLTACKSWSTFACAVFDHAHQTAQPYFHLYGHSHEVETFRLWDQLETFLQHAQRSGVTAVSNADVLG